MAADASATPPWTRPSSLLSPLSASGSLASRSVARLALSPVSLCCPCQLSRARILAAALFSTRPSHRSFNVQEQAAVYWARTTVGARLCRRVILDRGVVVSTSIQCMRSLSLSSDVQRVTRVRNAFSCLTCRSSVCATTNTPSARSPHPSPPSSKHRAHPPHLLAQQQ